MNLFIGGNGSGKSNFLEAIGIASAALGRSLGDADIEDKGIRLSPPELMKSAHKNADTPKTLDLSCSFDSGVDYRCNLTSRENDPLLRFHSESCFFENGTVFGRSGNGSSVLGRGVKAELDKNRGMWDQIRVAYNFEDAVFDTLDAFSEYKIYSPQTDFLRGIRPGNVNQTPVGLHGEGLPTAVRQLIRQAKILSKDFDKAKAEAVRELAKLAMDLVFLPRWTNAVRVGQIDKSLVSRGIANPETDMVYFIDRFMKEGRNTLTAYDSSEGTLFLLFVAVLLSHSESPDYFALDNVDNALNPKLTRHLVETMIDLTRKVARENLDFGPKQIFLTSHNPTSLDAFDLFDDDLRVFVVKRDERGHSFVDRLQPREGYSREEWADAMDGRNLSQLWLDGLIAGANGLEEVI